MQPMGGEAMAAIEGAGLPAALVAETAFDPDAVKAALNGYRAADEKRKTRDPEAIADALIDTERREQQARRAARSSRSNPSLDATSLDVGDLVVACRLDHAVRHRACHS